MQTAQLGSDLQQKEQEMKLKQKLDHVVNSVFGNLVGSVPEDIAYCELVCRRAVCSPEDWESCANRTRLATKLAARKAQAAVVTNKTAHRSVTAVNS